MPLGNTPLESNNKCGWNLQPRQYGRLDVVEGPCARVASPLKSRLLDLFGSTDQWSSFVNARECLTPQSTSLWLSIMGPNPVGGRAGPDTGIHDGSLLPSHNLRPPRGVAELTSRDILEASYAEADEKLLKLEEELDVLLYSACSLREQRAKLTMGRLKYLEDGTTSVDGVDQLLEEYLELTANGRAVEDVIKTLKEECAASCSECYLIFSKIRTPSAKLHQSLRYRAGLAEGRPESSFVDRKAIADRVISAKSTATSTTGIVGAFGTGITYTTLFIVIDCTALQLFTLLYHDQLTGIICVEYRGSRGSVANRLLVYMMLVAAPLVVGFIFLGISVAMASGYLPVAILGYFVISIVVVALGALVIRLRSLRPGANELYPGDVRLPTSAIHPLQEKLYFFPGGPGYINYHRKHLAHGKE
ncbi:hypothetical protein JB92DRAFT_3123579 [Gautieria morchelliformis]|nr:hypothetical protein JB92DRAFT_3123579 [Gautieria morchelliformis]